MSKCIFCSIVDGVSPSHKVWEDEKHLAFLSIFPNTEGVTVVIPKQHHPSYFFDLPADVMHELLDAGQAVAKKLDNAFDDVGRTGLVAEGFGVDHVHLKLFPLHGTAGSTWEQRSSNIDDYFEMYRGYISSHDSHRADDSSLKETADKITNS